LKKRSKFLTAAIILAVVLLGLTVYEYGYVRVRSELSSMEEVASARTEILEKYLSIIADKPRLEENFLALKEVRKTENSKIIEGQTPSVAAAALQNAVKGLITARGGAISSERVDKPEDMGKFKMITITIDATMPDIRVLNDALYAIETQMPYLVIQELDARVIAYREPKDLMIKLKISGLTGGK